MDDDAILEGSLLGGAIEGGEYVPSIVLTIPLPVKLSSTRKRAFRQLFVKMPGHGHSLTIDAGWREVAEKALDFVKRVTTITTAKTA